MFRKTTTALALLTGLAGTAQADILAVATHPFPINTTQGLLPIYYGQPYLGFRTTKQNRAVKVTISANCAAAGGLYLRTMVDNQLTFTDNNMRSLFCHTYVNGQVEEQLATKVQTFVVPRAGQHTLTVSAEFEGSWYQLHAVNVIVEN